MDKQSNNSINEIKLLVLQLAQQFNKKFDEQARVIVDQREQLESQQEQIYNQRTIIDELAWQIRDLRDSVRKCSEQISNVHLKYYDDDYATTTTITNFNINNGRAENRLKLIIPEANTARQSNHKAGKKNCSSVRTFIYLHLPTLRLSSIPIHILFVSSFVHCAFFIVFVHPPSVQAHSGLFQPLFSTFIFHMNDGQQM